jgi:hypothetical protein
MQQRIIKILQNLANELQSRQVSPGDWTVEIKTALANGLGSLQENIGVYAHSVKPGTRTDWGEWLWDFTLAKQRPQSQLDEFKLSMVDRLLVTAEIERNTKYDQIAIDFQKLVFAKSDLKLYIFPKNTPEYNRDIAQFCWNLADVDQSVGDSYLIIGMPLNSLDPKLDVYTWRNPEQLQKQEVSA